jgi:hypothetical protein
MGSNACIIRLLLYHQRHFSFEKSSGKQTSDPKFGRRGVVFVIPVPGNKVPERRSGLRPSEKELMKRRSGAFRHKNTPVYQ